MPFLPPLDFSCPRWPTLGKSCQLGQPAAKLMPWDPHGVFSVWQRSATVASVICKLPAIACLEYLGIMFSYVIQKDPAKWTLKNQPFGRTSSFKMACFMVSICRSSEVFEFRNRTLKFIISRWFLKSSVFQFTVGPFGIQGHPLLILSPKKIQPQISTGRASSQHISPRFFFWFQH